MPKKTTTVEHTSREVIENKLLARLAEKDTVAILCSEQDLSTLITALEICLDTRISSTFEEKVKEFVEDLRKLREGAFGH